MVKEHGEVEDRSGHGKIVDGDTGFIEMPPSRSGTLGETYRRNHETGQHVPNNEDCRVLGELVLLPVGLEVNLPPDGVTQVDLASDHVRKCGGRRVWSNVRLHELGQTASWTYLRSRP